MYRKFVKRPLGLLLSLIGLPIFAVIFIIIGPAIMIEDHGPIFYNAPRLGKNGRIFKMYKFRSMKVNAPDLRNEDGTTYNAEDDPRVTKIGRLLRKTSLDETPQLLNVLKGDMAFIGPRPDLPEAINKFTSEEKRKLDVLPGITGYSQAYHRNLIEIHERYREDVFYADNVSFLFDCKILFQTLLTVFSKKGIYRDETGRNIHEVKKWEFQNDCERNAVGEKKSWGDRL